MSKINELKIGNISYVNLYTDDAIKLGASQADVDLAINKTKEIESKKFIRLTIEREVTDYKSLLGTTSDASSYALDDTVMDILAVEASADSSYKAARISLFEELHGEDSWQTAVTYSQAWFDKRKTKEIKLTTDVKGIQKVFEEVATRSTGVATILEQAAQA